VLADSFCHTGYALLEPEQQAVLRGALVRSVDATCEDCPAGLDLTQAAFSVTVFAETLAANCVQAGRIVENASGQTPGAVSSYEDLWRFTLVNYNAGPGCLTLALQAAVEQGEDLNWEDVSSNLTPTCQPAIDYVDTISQ
jgi:membrane-bound lytic murein transglycosylase MltF